MYIRADHAFSGILLCLVNVQEPYPSNSLAWSAIPNNVVPYLFQAPINQRLLQQHGPKQEQQGRRQYAGEKSSESVSAQSSAPGLPVNIQYPTDSNVEDTRRGKTKHVSPRPPLFPSGTVWCRHMALTPACKPSPPMFFTPTFFANALIR